MLMPKRYLKILILLLVLPCYVWAQLDSSVKNKSGALRQNQTVISGTLSQTALSLNFANDSLKKVADSLAFAWVKKPDPNRVNLFRDSLIKVYQVYDLNFAAWAKKIIKNKNRQGDGMYRKVGDRWVLIVVLCLIIGFVLLKNLFNKEVSMVLNAFFDQRFLSQGPAAGNFFNTWPFFFLYLLFGFTIGMYLFLAQKILHLSSSLSDWSWYIILSLLIILLFALKVLLIRFLGMILQVQKVVKTYVSILFLSYFHIAIFLLPLIFAFSLSQASYASVFLYAGIVFTSLILVYQLVRVSIHILYQYQFSKFYLFIYFCALEVCPILILIKALRF